MDGPTCVNLIYVICYTHIGLNTFIIHALIIIERYIHRCTLYLVHLFQIPFEKKGGA